MPSQKALLKRRLKKLGRKRRQRGSKKNKKAISRKRRKIRRKLRRMKMRRLRRRFMELNRRQRILAKKAQLKRTKEAQTSTTLPQITTITVPPNPNPYSSGTLDPRSSMMYSESRRKKYHSVVSESEDSDSDYSKAIYRRSKRISSQRRRALDPSGLREIERNWLDRINSYRSSYQIAKVYSDPAERNELSDRIDDYLLDGRKTDDIMLFAIKEPDMTGRPIRYWIEEAEKNIGARNGRKSFTREERYGLLFLLNNLKSCDIVARQHTDGQLYVGIKTRPSRFKKKMYDKHIPKFVRKTLMI